ncbi:putative nucleic acid-binding protein [Nonomuraea thailandensis]|uniref:Nucleic acid-binding protein n=1 Tax=Nonomuraea thailandensis TaxID=1188745 RepID=A0A9X2G6L5_9ACTN|nr:hypothetical protein [Nonomuraea thailandensis]MCP2353534.1 putative nucleic acid-binding protein [Nonomuraea thailandensis]
MTLPPLILDTGVLIELARGDLNLMEMVARWDEQGQPMVMSVVAVAAAARNSGSKDSADLLLGIATMGQITVAGLGEPEHGIILATVLGRTDLDWGDAHVAALADTSMCPILTLDSSSWTAAIRAFEEPLHVIEISDPPD